MRVQLSPQAPFIAKHDRQSVLTLRSLPFALRFFAPVAQSTEHRASNAEVEGASPSGNTISSRNANRTSEPGLLLRSHAVRLRVIRCAIAQAFGANEIVLPPCGMGSMSSAFRHFIFHVQTTLSSNWPRHPAFYRITAGSSAVRDSAFS